MSSYRDSEIFKISFELAIKVHNISLKLPTLELYEQGSQIRRASKHIPDTIVEGYGRKINKEEFIRFLIFTHSSSDEVTSQIFMLNRLYPELINWMELHKE
ncbi:MAG TPA: four helix bundle protein [Bacteroidia bacterium]|nr:four helix bundle protein [Sphingobacteriales bacterium]HPD64261.1 four helix bundle protein [Bacteroidia bacterium]HRS58002.1 four helix bundle protein [Bacteroidia bacterium]HRU69263.1 four helix bundle protein [Bacteroidia bacterium]